MWEGALVSLSCFEAGFSDLRAQASAWMRKHNGSYWGLRTYHGVPIRMRFCICINSAKTPSIVPPDARTRIFQMLSWFSGQK